MSAAGLISLLIYAILVAVVGGLADWVWRALDLPRSDVARVVVVALCVLLILRQALLLGG